MTAERAALHAGRDGIGAGCRATLSQFPQVLYGRLRDSCERDGRRDGPGELEERGCSWNPPLGGEEPTNRDQTVAALLADQRRRAGDTSAHHGIKKRFADAETRLRRLREVIEAGARPRSSGRLAGGRLTG